MIDPMISLAFSVYSNKGAYSLLLGSGISRASGIPTGWEVVLDLIRKVAKLEGEDCDPDPAAWFKRKHTAEPDYSKLLDAIAKTPTERQQLLRGYFEPTEDERAQGVKAPNVAHKAIARLVEAGYLRVIVTTNFDRLMEQALEGIGIPPTVISTPDQVAGALPLAHSGVTLIKIHGDYLDTRIKNTESELAAYEPAFVALLDRVVDEYGLIVCGWSADWDIALRAAIERCPTRRFTTYWTTRSSLSSHAKRLVDHRKAAVLKIRDANQLFEGLLEKVRALGDMAAPHPLSAKMAVATLKRYLVDPAARIKLHDVVQEETQRVYPELGPKNFPVGHPQPSIEELSKRAQHYEVLVDTLLAIVTTGCFWGEKQHVEIWPKPAERIANQPRIEGAFFEHLDSMRTYPALLLLYGGGIAAMAAQKYDTFAALMTRPRYFDGNQRRPLVTEFSGRSVSFMDEQSGRRTPIRLSWHLHRHFRSHFNHLIPDDEDFRNIFDRFELFFGLVRMNLSQGDAFWTGDYVNRYRYNPDRSVEKAIEVELSAGGDSCPYLKAGLFDGSADKMKEIQAMLIEKQKRLRHW